MRFKNVLYGVVGCLVFVGVAFLVDKIDQYKTTGIVNTIYQNEAIMFQTEDGNTWLVETDNTDNIECGDEYVLTFKEYENTNIYDDAIVNYKPIQ